MSWFRVKRVWIILLWKNVVNIFEKNMNEYCHVQKLTCIRNCDFRTADNSLHFSNLGRTLHWLKKHPFMAAGDTAKISMKRWWFNNTNKYADKKLRWSFLKWSNSIKNGHFIAQMILKSFVVRLFARGDFFWNQVHPCCWC